MNGEDSGFGGSKALGSNEAGIGEPPPRWPVPSWKLGIGAIQDRGNL